MVANIANAISAYQNVPQGQGLTARDAGGKDFATFVQEAAESAVATMREGENMTVKAIHGEAELTDVVAAVNNAEVTLQTVVNIRDRMVQAYQEILRMPI